MKLVDILARELKEWPDTVFTITQDDDGKLNGNESDYPPVLRGITWAGGAFYLDSPINVYECFIVAVSDDWTTAIVTRAEWQAAVDALNAPKVVEWDGSGSPDPGASIEYSIGDGWYPCEVRYVLNRDDCPGIALIAWCEHLGKDQYLSNDRDHTFRPARTAEQVAAEEREKAIDEMVYGACGCQKGDGTTTAAMICGFIYDAGYRKEPKPCGS